MKKRIKKILSALGLFTIARKTYQKPIIKKYKGSKDWALPIKELDLKYSTLDSYSWSWFYPRYTNGKIHEPVATKIFINEIHPESTVLDIGAHLGYFTCIAGKLASKGKVHAFEVDPKCIQLINKNIAINSLNSITVHNVGVSDREEIVRIQKLEKPNPGLIINSKSTANFIEISSITIDDFLSQHKLTPNFIKIDVEGAEEKVLRGMENTLKQKHLTLLLEIHVDLLKNHFNTDYRDIIKLLRHHNFKIENIDHRLTKSTYGAVNESSVLKGNTMILCKK
ncbi:FkbM family methyltransferase [Cochleicola gelatinilyticus]|uniref:Methyltransferase FkbM domain-containing protein n=1 Tax=Cochleicola gelatinilyticus TaxID=1763537 RepID=A0A167IVP8_9FLAO|nr:FkbM family methyltransferase [Cochleicola gelatinilyticus]OAB80063.1 hypothetical protein ULVI_04800 [Cochleicola gelatinilyticus]